MRKRAVIKRAGTTLLEFLVFVCIGVVVIAALYYILSKGMTLQDSTQKSIDMMIQARTVIENLRFDCEGAILYLPPETGEGKELVLIKDTSDVAMARYQLNANDPETTPYPFRKSGEETIYQLPVCRVKYLYNDQEKTITRTQEFGVLAYGDAAELSGTVCRYEFAAASEPAPTQKVVGTDIDKFFVALTTVDRAGKPRAIQNLTKDDFYLDDTAFGAYAPALQHSEAAVVFVHLKSRFDKGLYGKDAEDLPEGSRKDRRAEEVEVVTKIVSPKCLADVTDREWFSSIDRDLSY